MTQATDSNGSKKRQKSNGGERAAADAPMISILGDVQSVVAAQRETFDGMMAANLDFIEFVGRRMCANADALRSLTECNDWQEMANVQNRLATETAKEYFDQTIKLMSAATERLTQHREHHKA